MTSALAGPLGNIVGSQVIGGALAGAAGSIAGQGFGVATGLQEKFSFKQVGLAAIAGGVAGGLNEIGGAAGRAAAVASKLNQPVSALTRAAAFIGGSGVGSAVVRGAISSAATQGLSVATGLQDSFSWTGVAAAGIGGGVSSALGGAFGKITATGFGETAQQIGQGLSTGMADTIAQATTRSALNGASFDDNLIASIPSVIGNTVGNVIASQIESVISREAPVEVADASPRYFEQPTDGQGNPLFGPQIVVTGRRLDDSWFGRFFGFNSANPLETFRAFGDFAQTLATLSIGAAQRAENSRYNISARGTLLWSAPGPVVRSGPTASSGAWSDRVRSEGLFQRFVRQTGGLPSARELGGGTSSDPMERHITSRNAFERATANGFAHMALGPQDVGRGMAGLPLTAAIDTGQLTYSLANNPWGTIRAMLSWRPSDIPDSIAEMVRTGDYGGIGEVLGTPYLGLASELAVARLARLLPDTPDVRTRSVAPEISTDDFLMDDLGIADPAIRQQIVDAGFDHSILSEATPRSFERAIRLFANPLTKGKSYSGRLGDLYTRARTIEIGAQIEQSGLRPSFEYRVETPDGQPNRYVDIVGLDSISGAEVQAYQLVRTGANGRIPAREASAAAAIENALGIPVEFIRTGL